MTFLSFAEEAILKSICCSAMLLSHCLRPFHWTSRCARGDNEVRPRSSARSWHWLPY